MYAIVLGLNTLIFLYMFSMWGRKNWLNTMIKFVLLVMSIANGVLFCAETGILILNIGG